VRRLRPLIAVMSAVLVLSACGAPPSGPAPTHETSRTPSSSTSDVRDFHNAGPISFFAPRRWSPLPVALTTHHSAVLSFFTNQGRPTPCPPSFYATGATTTCGPKDTPMRSGGVLLWWSSNQDPSWSIRNEGGQSITVDGRQARLILGLSDGCNAVGADRAIRVVVARHDPHAWFELDACMTEPGVRSDEASISQLLDSVTIVAP
jgi:hypothetical protein